MNQRPATSEQRPVWAGWSSSVSLLEGDAGTEQTIAAIRAQVDAALRDPLVRATAGAIVRCVRPYDDLGEVRTVYHWVLRSIRFRKDPIGKETISSARWTLTHGFGDCDDINAILLPSLLGALGYRTRLVTISNNPMAPEQFSHVYAEVFVRGRWIPVDAARPRTRFGAAPSRYFRKRLWSLTDSRFEDVRGLNGEYMGGWADDLSKVFTAITPTITSTITALRTPKASLVPVPAAAPSTFRFADSVGGGAGINMTTLLIGGALVVGAYFLAKKAK